MKYKTSFLDKHIILEDLKRYWGIAAVYFLISFLNGPLEIISTINNPNGVNTYIVNRILGIGGSEIQFMLSIGFPVLLSILIYRYLQQSKSTTLMHSFPITRKELFHSHNIASFLLILVPILINTIILLIVCVTYNGDNATFMGIFTVSRILTWMGLLISINFCVYLIATTVAMITGISLFQGILTIIFLFLPIGLGLLIIMNFEQLIYGFAINYYNYENIIMRISPVTRLLSSYQIGGNMIIWHLILGVMLYSVSYYFYQKRQLESASDSIAFSIMKPIFKYGVTFCAMVLAGTYFNAQMGTDLWLYVGYGIGGFLGYIIAEMIINKSIWVFKNIKGFIVYSVIMTIVFLGIKGDIIGYERRIPDLEDIQTGYYARGLYDYWHMNSEEAKTADDIKILKDIKNIERIRHLHDQLLESKDKFMNAKETGDTSKIGIVYELKNGAKIAREYTVPLEFIENNQYIKEIYESREYKIDYYGIFDLDIDKINYLELRSDVDIDKERIKIIDNNEIKEVISIIKSDILDETYEEFCDFDNKWGYIYIYYENKNNSSKVKTISVNWKRSYKGLTKWIKDKGYYERIVIMPKDVEYIIVQETSEDLDINDFLRTIDIGELDKDKEADRILIKKSSEIEEILNKCSFGYFRDKKYIIGVYLKNGKKLIRYMD